MKPIDVPSNGLLKYINENRGNSFQYKLANVEKIICFNLIVNNQDDELIPIFSDYLLLLQFIDINRRRKIRKFIKYFNRLCKTNIFINKSFFIPGKFIKKNI